MDDEWISSRTFAEALRAGVGGNLPVRSVFDRAIAGLLRARPAKLLKAGVEIPGEMLPEHWRGRIEKQNWIVGDFTILTEPSKYRFVRIEGFGVEFLRSDAERMGAVIGAEMSPPQSVISAQSEPNEDLGAWAKRLVSCGVPLRGFTKATLTSTWRGTVESIPAVKVAQAALRDEWVLQGRTGPGNPSRQA